MDFKRRLTGLQAKMEEQGLDLVVYGGSPDLQYLTGVNLEWRRGRDLLYPQDNVFVPRSGEPVLTINPENVTRAQGTWIKDVRVAEKTQPYGEMVKKIVTDLGVKPGRVAIGDYCWGSTSLEVAKSCAGSRFRVGEGLLDSLRMIKEPEEVAKLKKAAEVTESVMSLISPRIVDGLTQRNLQIMMEMMGRGLGATDASFPPTGGYLKTGTIPSEDPFIYPREAGLAKGTSIAFDFGLVVDGYCSDWGRSFYYGTAPSGHTSGIPGSAACRRAGGGRCWGRDNTPLRLLPIHREGARPAGLRQLSQEQAQDGCCRAPDRRRGTRGPVAQAGRHPATR